MGPLDFFPPEFPVDVPSSRDHVHYVKKSMYPLGLRDIFIAPMLFTERNMFLRMLNAFVSVG
jgi:hypothetical protein